MTHLTKSLSCSTIYREGDCVKRDEKTEKNLKELLHNSLVSGGNIYAFDCLTSTNDEAKKLAEFLCPQWTLVLSDSQTAGRGRLGRQFLSPDGHGLYMSFVLRPQKHQQNPGLLTACGAVSVYRAILHLTGMQTQIKWVNDIYSDGKKLCGILAEGQFDTSGALNAVILGIGLNLMRPKEGYNADIDHKTIALNELIKEGSLPQKEILCAKILKEFAGIYNSFPKVDFLDDYRKASCVIEQKISYRKNGVPKEGIALAIDDEARLVIQNHSGETEILGTGEIDLVRPIS